MTKREAAEIIVRLEERGPPLRFEVAVRDAAGATRHAVTMSAADAERLGAGTAAPDAVVAAAFRFLLDREPKEAILARFDVSVIGRYLPEFAAELPRYLAQMG